MEVSDTKNIAYQLRRLSTELNDIAQFAEQTGLTSYQINKLDRAFNSFQSIIKTVKR